MLKLGIPVMIPVKKRFTEYIPFKRAAGTVDKKGKGSSKQIVNASE